MLPRPPRRLLAAGLALAALASPAHAGPPAPEPAADAPPLRLFLSYDIVDADGRPGLAGLHARSVQGAQWRQTLVYNEVEWQPGRGDRTLARGDTAMVTPGPWQRTWLTLGDRSRDAGLLPVRLAGVDLRGGAAAAQHNPLERSHAADAVSAGELDIYGGRVEIRGFGTRSSPVPLAYAEAPPPLALPAHVVDPIDVAQPLAVGDRAFEYALGTARAADDVASSYGGAAFIAASRIGLTDHFTLGAHALASGPRSAAGFDGTLGLGDLGTLGSDAGIARDGDSIGPAATWRYALNRGPLDVRARFRMLPGEADATAFAGTDRAIRDTAARVSWLLPDARVLSVESRHVAFVQRSPESSLLVGYSLARDRMFDVQGRIGYTSGAVAAGGSDAWSAMLMLRVALNGDASAGPACAAHRGAAMRGCASP